MSDIFLSYDPKDEAKAENLALILDGAQWTVWQDSFLNRRGTTWDRGDELINATAVVVLWSRAAAESHWVRGVLERAGWSRLIVVELDKTKLPPEVTSGAALDFSDWDGEREGPVWNMGVPELLELIARFVGKPPRLAESPPPPPTPSRVKASGELPPKKVAESAAKDEGRFDGVFISYRRGAAAAYAGRLYDRLVARFGKERVFLDMANVGWGEDFVEAITSAAESCAVMIALVSPRWSRGGQEEVDDYVRLEVAKALGRRIRVIPILIQGASMPAPRELPEDLAPLVRRNALALSDTRWERDVEDLLKTLEELLKS